MAPFARTQTTTTDQQTSLLAGSERHVLGVRHEASPRERRHRNPHPRGAVPRRTAGGQGLCAGLDVSLLEVVGVGLITYERVGVVKRVHTLLGGVHRLATALKARSAGGSARDKG